jgi:hypothetical protein
MGGPQPTTRKVRSTASPDSSAEVSSVPEVVSVSAPDPSLAVALASSA